MVSFIDSHMLLGARLIKQCGVTGLSRSQDYDLQTGAHWSKEAFTSRYIFAELANSPVFSRRVSVCAIDGFHVRIEI